MTTTADTWLTIRTAGGHEITLTWRMIEEVVAEWKQDNPGRNASDMGSEFATRCLAKVSDSERRDP